MILSGSWRIDLRPFTPSACGSRFGGNYRSLCGAETAVDQRDAADGRRELTREICSTRVAVDETEVEVVPTSA